MSKAEQIERRAMAEAKYVIKSKCTVRECARAFGVSKSTVHKDLTERLPEISKRLHDEVCIILRDNFDVKHIRGGASTRMLKLSRRAS